MKLITRTFTPLALAAFFAAHSAVWAAPKTEKTKAKAPAKTEKTTTKARSDPATVKAQQLLKGSAAAYKGLNGYSSDVSWSNGSPDNLTGRVAWQRPDQLMAEVKMPTETYQKYLSDGKTVEVKIAGEETIYTSVETEDATAALPAALGQLGPVGLSLGTFLTDADPLAAYKDTLKSVSSHVASAEEAAGLDLKPNQLQVVDILLELKRGTDAIPVKMVYTLGEKDKLVRRFSVNYQVGDSAISQTETYTNVKANPKTAADALKFVPAAEAQQVDDLDPRYDASLRVGAMPIELKATDLEGKPISFDDYKGKVVLVDFWATWCPPCREEMPNVIATYNKYHDKGFDIIGISLDNSKDALDKYIADNKMPWRQVFDGKGWDSAAGKTFSVQAIPFAMIIGRDGKIAALNARGEALEKAVVKALDAPA